MVVLACGCGGGGGDVVTIHAQGSPLVVGQDGHGPWQELALDADGVAHLDVTQGFYGVIVFCADESFSRADGRFETDLADIRHDCDAGFDPVEIAGVTAPGTAVYAGQL